MNMKDRKLKPFDNNRVEHGPTETIVYSREQPVPTRVRDNSDLAEQVIKRMRAIEPAQFDDI